MKLTSVLRRGGRRGGGGGPGGGGGGGGGGVGGGGGGSGGLGGKAESEGLKIRPRTSVEFCAPTAVCLGRSFIEKVLEPLRLHASAKTLHCTKLPMLPVSPTFCQNAPLNREHN